MLQNHCKVMNFSPNNQKKTQKNSQACYIFLIWTTFFKFAYLIFLSMVPLFYPAHSPLHPSDKQENIPQIDIQTIFECDFCSFLAKIELKSQNICFLLVPYCVDCN